jgi:AcrR family transcriptional regulator
MPSSRSLTHQRLLQAAKELFTRQGITQTTTRQIAEVAGVNEVTLFRHFGSKPGLLLAVFDHLGVFEGIEDLKLDPSTEARQNVHAYLLQCFHALVDNPDLVRSVVGEAGSYSSAHQQALQKGFTQAQNRLTRYLQSVASGQDWDELSSASAMLHILVLGVAVLQITAGLPPLTSETEEDPASVWLRQAVSFGLQSLKS